MVGYGQDMKQKTRIQMVGDGQDMKQKTRIQWLGMAKICSRRPGLKWPTFFMSFNISKVYLCTLNL